MTNIKDIYKPIFNTVMKTESQISKKIILKNPEKYGLTKFAAKHLK